MKQKSNNSRFLSRKDKFWNCPQQSVNLSKKRNEPRENEFELQTVHIITSRGKSRKKRWCTKNRNRSETSIEQCSQRLAPRINYFSNHTILSLPNKNLLHVSESAFHTDHILNQIIQLHLEMSLTPYLL